MSKALTSGFALLAACALFACAGDGSDGTSTEESGTEPTLWSGSEDTATGADEQRAPTSERGDIAGANGASARDISHNHPEPHALVIPALDLAGGRGGTYTLSNGGGALGELHTHDVTLTAQQLSEIRDGAEITVESTVGGLRGGHTHFVTVSRR